MLLSIITFSTGSVSAVLAYSNILFGDLIYLLALIIGLPIAFWVIRKVASLARAR